MLAGRFSTTASCRRSSIQQQQQRQQQYIIPSRHRIGLSQQQHQRNASASASTSEDPRLKQPRTSDQVDVVIVGGGPAGLSAAIRLKQLAAAAGKESFRV